MTGGRIALASLVAVAVIVLPVVLLRSPVHRVYCDGAFPRWMLEAQGYEGGGCAEVLPTSEAPANADWLLYCVGMCDVASQEPLR